MLEGLVVWVLNNYLGKYVENLNTDQLSVALLSGKVELENLPLRKDALRHLGLPVEVKAGFIGKVQLQVPVRQIRSAPWIISIEKLYVVVSPVNLDEWDSTAEANIAHERKVSLLDALEAQWRAEHEAQDSGYYATSYSSWLSYGTGLLANIVENLQLKLKDVHIRYEDAVTGGETEAFACGLTVESLSAESCDSDWVRGFTLLSDKDTCSYKLMELHKMAIYFDHIVLPSGLLANLTLAELAVRMSASETHHTYIQTPSSAVARIRRERSEQPLRSRTRPRMHCCLTLDNVSLNLTDRQYKSAVRCVRGLSELSVRRSYCALRPGPGSAPRAWWVYAIKSHLPHHVWMDPRPTWDSCLARSRQLRAYVEVVVWMLSNPASTLPPPKKAVKDELEWNWPLHLIKPLREIAMRKVPRVSPATTPNNSGAGRSMLVHWFPQWWGWYGSPDSGTPPDTPDLEEEILDVIADSLDNNTLLKRDTVFGQFEFKLNSGCLNLNVAGVENEKESCPRVALQFSAVHLSVESRPRAGAVSLTVRVGDVMLRDRLTPRTLYPVLVAPQGMIREGLSALNSSTLAQSRGRQQSAGTPAEPLFLLTYDTKPYGLSCDYRLYVKSQSLEVVYNSDVVHWVSEFFTGAWRSGPLAAPPRELYQSVRDSTRMKILTRWEQLLQGQPNERSSWQIELDISAPQILLVEDFTDREAAVMLVDFGKMRLTHAEDDQHPATDDEDLFMTPCSTPPASRESRHSLQSPPSAVSPPPPPALDHAELHKRLYDTYSIELSDLQVLVGRARDNWKYAHTKTTSSLHLLDRFTISLQAERRVVNTSDPQFPSATLCGALPALVVHLSEQKVSAVRAVVAAHQSYTEDQPRYTPEAEDARSECSESEHTEHSQHHNSSLIMLQFDVEQMSLEVQSRGRSIAEVQVMGVRAGAARRPRELALALSVHSLLLVDALQTCGPDYELLVASHRHVGMDAASGSILGSEPTSPTSPASPTTTSLPAPLALATALSSLASRPSWEQTRKAESELRSPKSRGSTWGANNCGWGGNTTAFGNNPMGWRAGFGTGGMVDSEALIAVEYCFVQGEGDCKDDLRIANILFNNLDIIANQETIVELIGFTQRITNSTSKKMPTQSSIDTTSSLLAMAGSEDSGYDVRTEITFDFHRLGVLVVRAASHEGTVRARKVATATLSEAKIQATLDKQKVSVRGSLGGLQVVSQHDTPGPHSQVLAVGHAAPHADLYRAADQHEDKALSFTVLRTVETEPGDAEGVVSVVARVHVASVRYTHAPRLLADLRSCAADFTRYLANLARSIRNAAHDMAVGLVLPARNETIQVGGKVDGVSPRRRTTSISTSLDNESLADCLKSDTVVLSISVEVESPVVVLPLSAHSPHVFVSQLGRMSLANCRDNRHYRLQLTDISIYTLELTDSFPSSAELGGVLAARGRPVLHDTALHLSLHFADTCEITGKIVGGLRVSSTREQYEQLLETLRFMSEERSNSEDNTTSTENADDGVDEVEGAEAGPAVTLRLDPQVRAQTVVPPPEPTARGSFTAIKVNFKLPTFTMELRGDFGSGERSLVELSFQEFHVQYDRLQPHETSVQVSLHSVTMEDLTKDIDSKHRMLMMSHTPQVPKAVFVSKSCPDFVTQYPEETLTNLWSKSSLPSELNTLEDDEKRIGDRCGPTPPCSPECVGNVEGGEEEEERLSGDQNLVWISVHMRDSQHPLFEEKFNKVSKFIKVDFNCLNLLVSIDSWVVVLDFFGVAADDDKDTPPPPDDNTASSPPGSETTLSEYEVRVRSLSVILVSRAGQLARAHASRLVLSGGPATPAGLRGSLGLVLTDLTPGPWRTRLSTTDPLTLHYQRFAPSEASRTGYTSALSVSCGAVRYVHTKRFVAQLIAYFADFELLRRVLREARRKVSVVSGRARRARIQLRCSAVLVLPVSARSRHALQATVSELRSDNCYMRAGDQRSVSHVSDPDRTYRELLDVRSVVLEGASLFCVKGPSCERSGPPLLNTCSLTLQVERNVDLTNNVPDMTVHGSLASLECVIDRAQYAVLRGVLAHNLGEHVATSHAPQPAPRSSDCAVWKLTSLQLDLQNVLVRLEPIHGVSSLACINFIRSRLMVENYSDLSQDIDLVSQEILISDTRYSHEPANRRGNVFTLIAAPLPANSPTNNDTPTTKHSVQAELHARRRPTSAAYTVLVNSMRLMVVLDWWQQAKDFLTQPPKSSGAEEARGFDHIDGRFNAASSEAENQMELKINITESQLVLVEDASVWDTNAVILKSTTVMSYRSAERRPLSCSLSSVEVLSCVLGLEDETALGIVTPAEIHAELHAEGTLHIQMNTLDLRLSYHDMRMFAAMLKSLRAQAAISNTGTVEVRKAPANSAFMSPNARVLTAMGFSTRDADAALKECSGCVNEAALWLTTHADLTAEPAPRPLWPLRAVQVRAECVTLCVIDDCLDSDVPLLEVSLKDLILDQDLRRVDEALEEPPLAVSGGSADIPLVPLSPGGGSLGASLVAHYYNRTLSGWEPGIETWRFSSSWEYQMSADLRLRRLQLDVRSEAVLDINLTDDLLRLIRRTRDTWAAEQSNPGEQSPKSSPVGHRRRSPFVPYALRNHTGHKLWFTTVVADADELTELEPELEANSSWVMVRAGDTAAFSFGRAREHSSRSHQVALRVEGWLPVGPVCVDRVGDYYRRARHMKSSAAVPIVMEVSLEGSARKLVTVRSAVLLRNKLPHALEVRVDHAPAAGSWGVTSSRTVRVSGGTSWPAPLSAARCPLWCRPLAAPEVFLFCDAPLPTPGPGNATQQRIDNVHYCRCNSTADNVYRFCCVSVQQAFPTEGMWGLTLTLVPALRLENLLPLELHYRVTDRAGSVRSSGDVRPGDTVPQHEVNMEEGVEISVKLDGFGWSTPLSILPSATTSFSARVKLLDRRARRLYLNTRTHIKRTDAIKVSISAAYWLVNRTGLPLVFRAEGAGEAAGQGPEHEEARLVQPLPFCFAEPDAAPTLQARLGRGLYSGAEWCSPFGLGPGTYIKRLEARSVVGGASGGVSAGGAEGAVLDVGVATRAGRGRYRHTNIVTLCPRYQIHNNTPYTLHLAQKWAATSLKDPGAAATVLCAAPGCYLPWQWSRWEREQLLSVRLPRGSWSGAFKVSDPRTTHVLCKQGAGAVCLRVEVVSQGATMFVVLTDADTAPPPLTLLNHSDVAIMFHQVGCSEESVVGAHSLLNTALPEPERSAALSLRAPGGARVSVTLRQPASPLLRYQNFLYVAIPSTADPSEGEDSCLVLEVPMSSTKVVLGRKRNGDRSQLWRLGPGQQLIHEGSSPPQNDARLYDAPITPHDMVLDIEGPAPRPGARTALCLRRADSRRASTQAWSLRRGAMTCAHHTLRVQPDRPGNRVVLGLAGDGPTPPEHQVEWQRLRPGSGRLRVTVSNHGPTSLITITDEEAKDGGYITGALDPASPPATSGVSEWGVRVWVRGVGVSLVADVELAYVMVEHLAAAVDSGRGRAELSLTARALRGDNQLFDTPHPVFLYCLQPGDDAALPALHLDLQLTRSQHSGYNAVFFSHVVLCLRPLAVRLEERLMLKLWQWIAWPDDASALELPDETDYEAHRMLAELTAVTSTRYYFRSIRVAPSQIRLSMATAGKLERELMELKKKLGLTLVGFEDAAVELQPFLREHRLDTAAHLAREMVQHFKDQLKWQAAKILGSVDFLGNPLGFVSDVSEGVSGLIHNGSVGALLQNITHGISNSAAKVSESLGDGLERVVVDEAHEETRRRLRTWGGERSHLAAGLRGLGLGLLGGVTSLVKHSYEGAAAEGVAGFVAGVGKGLVGTVTKPVIGVLDLAAEAAAAVRERARSDRGVPERVRAPRQVCSGALLAPYCSSAAAGAAMLARLAPGDSLLAYGVLRAPPHAVLALISARHVRILAGEAVALQAALADVRGVTATGALVELRLATAAGERRPRVRCDNDERAGWLARHAAAAAALHLHAAHRAPPQDTD